MSESAAGSSPVRVATQVAAQGMPRRVFPAVIGALVCVHASMAATRVTASLYLLHEGKPALWVGVLLALFAVAPIALSLWAGRLADRHGMHRPLGWGVVLGVMGAGLAAISQEIAVLAVAALLTGGAVSVAAVGIQREAGLMARHPGDLKRVFSWVALGPAVSNAVSPVVVGLLIDHVGFRAGFVFAAVLPLLAGVLGRWVPRMTMAQDPSKPRPGMWSAVRGLWALPALRRLILVNLAMSACWDSHSFVVPVLGHARGMSASAIGMVLGGFALAATLVRWGISRWADRLSEVQALRVAMSLAALICAVYAWMPGVAGMVVASAMLGLALGSVQPMVLALLHQAAPPGQQGQALGMRMLMVNAAATTVPLGFGALAGWAGPASPMWFMAVVVGLALWPARRLGTVGRS